MPKNSGKIPANSRDMIKAIEKYRGFSIRMQLYYQQREGKKDGWDTKRRMRLRRQGH